MTLSKAGLCSLLLSLATSAHAQTLVPADQATLVNPDIQLKLTFASTPRVGRSGQVRIYDAADNRLVDTLDLAIPPGPTEPVDPAIRAKNYLGFPYPYARASRPTNQTTKPGTPCERCTIRSTRVMMWPPNPQNVHGNVFKNSTFIATAEPMTVARSPKNETYTYPYAEAVLLNSTLTNIAPEAWGDADRGGNVRFWEFNSRHADGAPVDVRKRAPVVTSTRSHQRCKDHRVLQPSRVRAERLDAAPREIGLT